MTSSAYSVKMGSNEKMNFKRQNVQLFKIKAKYCRKTNNENLHNKDCFIILCISWYLHIVIFLIKLFLYNKAQLFINVESIVRAEYQASGVPTLNSTPRPYELAIFYGRILLKLDMYLYLFRKCLFSPRRIMS